MSNHTRCDHGRSIGSYCPLCVIRIREIREKEIATLRERVTELEKAGINAVRGWHIGEDVVGPIHNLAELVGYNWQKETVLAKGKQK